VSPISTARLNNLHVELHTRARLLATEVAMDKVQRSHRTEKSEINEKLEVECRFFTLNS
jgi:hypothetical protein